MDGCLASVLKLLVIQLKFVGWKHRKEIKNRAICLVSEIDDCIFEFGFNLNILSIKKKKNRVIHANVNYLQNLIDGVH